MLIAFRIRLTCAHVWTAAPLTSSYRSPIMSLWVLWWISEKFKRRKKLAFVLVRSAVSLVGKSTCEPVGTGRAPSPAPELTRLIWSIAHRRGTTAATRRPGALSGEHLGLLNLTHVFFFRVCYLSYLADPTNLRCSPCNDYITWTCTQIHYWALRAMRI